MICISGEGEIMVHFNSEIVGVGVGGEAKLKTDPFVLGKQMAQLDEHL